MVRHIVSWNFREDVPEEKREEVRNELKKAFPALVGKIPGLLKAEVGMPPLGTSNCDMSLYCELNNAEDIPVYANHPEHLKVAAIVRANCEGRRAVDMEME